MLENRFLENCLRATSKNIVVLNRGFIYRTKAVEIILMFFYESAYEISTIQTIIRSP